MLWNSGELPQHWTVAKLKGKHPSRPFNPDIANAFFRAGHIEAWGRGIERIEAACRAAGSPGPELRYEPNGLWVEFAYPQPQGNSVSDNSSVKTSVETTVKTSVKTPERVLELLRGNPNLTLADVAVEIGRSLRAVELVSSKLVRLGRLKFVGPRKGGHWEVLK